jgi:DNA-directed RNA polymerase subunit RPC12/RpoP
MHINAGPRCYNCNAQMLYQGKTNRPVETIYRCNRCGVEVWQEDTPAAFAETKVEPQPTHT